MNNKYKVLKDYFGYDSFREGQELLIDAILAGRDVLGIMPTGAGKSICYQVPALLLPGITLVVSPLISLMSDQVLALNQAGVHAAYINSSLTEGQIAKALQLAAGGRYKIIYVAPERLETYEFMQFAKQAGLSMLTVDEAHCISQWGQDFRPSYLKIVQFAKQLPKRPIISAFTATATKIVKEDIACVLGLANPQVLVTGFDRENLYFAVETLARQKEKNAYVLDYIKKHPGESGIIYCATRKKVEAVYELLLKEGISAAKYHAGLTNEERKQGQEDFTYDRKMVMVATNAFGMGIDKSNIRYVLHYNMPQSMENYYQEAGRAGRDGEAAECVLLYSPQDMMIGRYFLEEKNVLARQNLEQACDVPEYDGEEELWGNGWEYFVEGNSINGNAIVDGFGFGGDGWQEPDVFAGGQEGNMDATKTGRSQGLREEELVSIREQDELRLQRMRNYCVTKDCLRSYILNYFGEYGKKSCGNCANCQKEFEESDVTAEAVKVIGCIREMGQRFGINMVTGTLLGANTAKLRDYNVSRHSLYGSLKGWREEDVKEIISILLTEGFLVQTKDKYALLKLTAQAKELAEGGKKIILKHAKREAGKEGVKEAGYASHRKSDILNSKGLELFELLRQLRTEIAGEEHVPPYVVFTDRTLMEMCIKLPADMRELRMVSGFGESRCARYGQRCLDKIQEFTGGERLKLYFGEIGEIPVSAEREKKRTDRMPKEDFFLTKEQIEKFPYTDQCLITELAVTLSELRDANRVKKLTGMDIQRFLTARGYMEEKRVDGQWKKIVYAKGQEIGLFQGLRTSKSGSCYEDVYCNQEAQKMIAEHYCRAEGDGMGRKHHNPMPDRMCID